MHTSDETRLELADRAERDSHKGRRDRDRGGGRAGGCSGQGRDVRISKALSRLLRHQAENERIALDAEGYAPLDRVMAWQPLRALDITWDDVQTAVRDNAKQRFALKKRDGARSDGDQDPAEWLIRANQGHSIRLASEAHLRPISLLEPGGGAAGGSEEGIAVAAAPVAVPAVVVHGTYFAAWPAIVASGGLRPMGRTHVHCATGLPEGITGGSNGGGGGGGGAVIISGMRADAELAIYIDVAASLRDDAMRWWISDNGVVLSEGDEAGLVPVKYFREVVGRKAGVGTLWRDGEWVADLPQGLGGSRGGQRGGRHGGRARGQGGRRGRGDGRRGGGGGGGGGDGTSPSS